MAIFSMQNCTIFDDGLDLTGTSNSVSMELGVNELDVTTFGSGGTTTYLAGLQTSKVSVGGFVDYTAATLLDSTQFAGLGTSNALMVAPQGVTAGNFCYAGTSLQTSYNMTGKMGEVQGFTADYSTNSKLVRSTILHSSTAITATGNGSATLMAAASSSQSIYFQIHVVSVSGTSTPTITASVRSSAVVGMTSPTTRATFTAITAVGAQRIVLAGPVTDTYYQVQYTISGATPSFYVVTTCGIA